MVRRVKKKRTKTRTPRNQWKKLISSKRNEKILLSILNKWGKDRAQLGGFVRFVDGNRGNMHIDNMTVVPLVDALENPDWVVDWDSELRTQRKDLLSVIGNTSTPWWLNFSKMVCGAPTDRGNVEVIRTNKDFALVYVDGGSITKMAFRLPRKPCRVPCPRLR